MPYVPRRMIDTAVYSYFEQVGLDVEATRDAIAQASDGKLAEVRGLLAQAQAESQRADERLGRVRRDYTEGKLDAEDWQQFKVELGAERDGAAAEVSRLSAQFEDVKSWSAEQDAERETLARLSQIRAAIINEVRGAEGVEAVRAALAQMFERFVLHRAGSSSVPRQVHAELAMGAPGFVIEPIIRADAIERLSEADAPILRRKPLQQAANNGGQEVGYRLVEG